MIAVLVGAVGIMILTWAGLPTVAPIAVGLLVGFWKPGRSARTAALAGAAAWGALLIVGIIKGDSILATSEKLGRAMGLPGWAPLVATVLYPAILAASAAWFGQLISPYRASRAARPSATTALPRP